MSNPNIAMTEPDIYGQRHPIETAEMIEKGLKDIETELAKIPTKDKVGWEQAKQKCPTLTGDDSKLMFLRAEVFNADLAAARLCSYWTRRISLFGPDKAFSPLTQQEGLKDEHIVLGMGFMQLLPDKDPIGKSVFFVDPSKQDSTKYGRDQMIKAAWYLLLAGLENEEAQKKGIVFISYPRHTKASQFDRVAVQAIVSSIRSILPVRVAAFHICHPPFFFAMIFPIVKIFLGARLRKRVLVHSGGDAKVLKQMEHYGLSNYHLPTELGGDIKLDVNKWLTDRVAIGKWKK